MSRFLAHYVKNIGLSKSNFVVMEITTLLLCMQLYNFNLITIIRGISLNVFRVDRILESAVGVQEYKNSITLGTNLKISLQICVTRPGLTEFLYC